MIDKILVKLLYEKGNGYTDIAKIVGSSKQYIHQIIKNYHNTGKRYREKFYENMKECTICKSLAVNLHHIDLDNTNDSITNLMPVCQKCHKKLHLLKVWSRYGDCCSSCKSTTIRHGSKGLCERCVYKKRYISKREFTWSMHYPFCQMCLSTEKRHSSRGVCVNCYKIWKYYKNKN